MAFSGKCRYFCPSCHAKRLAICQRWFGADDGSGAPNPPSTNDALIICALGQMDLCFDPVKIAPKFTYAEELARGTQSSQIPIVIPPASVTYDYSPCFGCGQVQAAP